MKSVMTADVNLCRLLWRKIMYAAVLALGASMLVYLFIAIAWVVTTLGFSLNILK